MHFESHFNVWKVISKYDISQNINSFSTKIKLQYPMDNGHNNSTNKQTNEQTKRGDREADCINNNNHINKQAIQ